jgi:hypothetical protein
MPGGFSPMTKEEQDAYAQAAANGKNNGGIFGGINMGKNENGTGGRRRRTRCRRRRRKHGSRRRH